MGQANYAEVVAETMPQVFIYCLCMNLSVVCRIYYIPHYGIYRVLSGIFLFYFKKKNILNLMN